MERKNIAIVGSTDAILPFNTFGVHCVKVTGNMNANEKVKMLAREYSIILIEEDIAKEVYSLISRYKAKPYPIILVLPSADSENGYAMDEINKNIEKAIGTSINIS